MERGSGYSQCSKKYPVPLCSGASSGSGGENEESEGTTTDGEGGQNSSEFIADGTLSAAGDDDGHLRFVKRPSLKCIGNVKLQAFDLGSHWIVPRVCKDYYAKVDDIVYMVDVTETEELAKSKEEISALWSVDLLTDVPFSILTRYCDDQTAFEDELCNLLGLNKGKVNLDERAIKVFMCKTVQDMGVEEVFKITR
ncbi:unnamed protein product [Sphagnum jensenii]|uniref:Uncharacterized protein n=1 Tax=Sphagnum jensenii TaxID=128206 RepID=A0ABP1AYA4_9BRYO